MLRPDRGTVQAAGFVVLLTGVFLLVNTQVVYAASSSPDSRDLLSPLNITSSEGVPINGYELNADGGSIVDFKAQALAFALSGLFTLLRLLVGLAGWSIELAFRFPLLKVLSTPAQRVADIYTSIVTDTLGLKGLLLAWAFVFAAFMIVRGHVGRGLGEIFLTLLLGALAASVFVRPDYLLSTDGPLGQGQVVAADVAQRTVNSYDWGGKIASQDPCASLAGQAELKCLQQEAQAPVSATDLARPIQDSLTNALVVKPFMLLEYGRILDPAKASDRQAYAVHLKWITGGYDPDAAAADKPAACDKIKGPAKAYCGRSLDDATDTSRLPSLTPGGQLLDATNAIVSDDDRSFAAFMQDMNKAGAVGKACADYAQEPTWWRVGGSVLLLLAAFFICGTLLAGAIVLLGTQGVCAGAAALGGVTFVAGMLPGPPRQTVWKWLSLWGIAVLALVAVCAFIPFFGIAIDATITNGPDLMVDRLLLLDVLAIVGAAAHRRLLAGITSFMRRMAMRMRFAKVGGTHLPGDTSELGAALALNSPAMLGGYGGGLRSFIGGYGLGAGGGRFGLLGTRHLLMRSLAPLLDGTGMSVDTGGLFSDAVAEAGRGLAPLAAAAGGSMVAGRLGLRGASWLLIGRRPRDEQLAKWRKPTAGGDLPGPEGGEGPGGGEPGGSGGSGPFAPRGPRDRYRIATGEIIGRGGQVLHDQKTDRTLLSTRAHNRLVRLRGYRILHRGGRAAYGGTLGLPTTVRRANAARSRFAADTSQQFRVWSSTVSRDARSWTGGGRLPSPTSRPARPKSPGGTASSSPARPAPPTTPPPTAPTPTRHPAAPSSPPPGRPSAPRSAPAARPAAPGSPPAGRPAASGPAAAPQGSGSSWGGPGRMLPGDGGASVRPSVRDEAQARFQDLSRRTQADLDRRRQKQERQARRRRISGGKNGEDGGEGQ